jgi:ABC-type spermidine/putrescine transport system permease subunit II
MRDDTRAKTFWAVGNAIVIIVAIIPVLWIASLSFKDPSTITDGTFLPRKWTLQNYRGIFDTSLFTRALVNSIGIALIATALAVVIGSMAAYAVARLRFPGKTLLVGAALLIAVFPPISLVSPLFNLWRQLGLFDTWPGLIIPYLTFSLPLAIYTLSAFFREIPWSLERAARVDGATPLQAFLRVIAPQARPRRGDHRDPGVHLLLERLRVRHLADLHQPLAHRAGGDRLLLRRLPVRDAGRLDRRGRGDHHHPDHHLRVHLPAADRGRVDLRRGEGLGGRRGRDRPGPRQQAVPRRHVGGQRRQP